MTFQSLLLAISLATAWSYNPHEAGTSWVWAIPRSLATTYGIIVYFLFLRVLRCFSSPRSPLQIADNRSATCWVVPFGNPRINGYLLLNAAYRSLSRPSSPVRAKASAIRPLLLSLDFNCLQPINMTEQSADYTFSIYLLLLVTFSVSNMSKISI